MGPKKANNNKKAAAPAPKKGDAKKGDAKPKADAKPKPSKKQNADDELLSSLQGENAELAKQEAAKLKAIENKLPKMMCQGCKKHLPSSRYNIGQVTGSDDPDKEKTEGKPVPNGYAWCPKCMNFEDPTKWDPKRWPAFDAGLPNINKNIQTDDLNAMVNQAFEELKMRTIKDEFGGAETIDGALEKIQTIQHPQKAAPEGVPMSVTTLYAQKSIEQGLHFPLFPPKLFGKAFTKVKATKDTLAAATAVMPKELTIANFQSFPNYLHRILLNMLLSLIKETASSLTIAMLYTHLKDHVGASCNEFKVSAKNLKVQFQYQYSVDENWMPVTIE